MKRKLKKAASLLLCFAMQFGTLATAAQAAYADSTAQTDIPPASDAANAQIEVTADKVTNGAQSFWASASVNGFNVRLNVTANGLQNADFRAAVMDADTYVRELRANPASMTYEQFEQPESAGITTTAHYLYKTGVKLGADNAAVTVPMGSLKPLALNNETAVTAGDQKTKYYRSYVYLIAVQQMGTAK